MARKNILCLCVHKWWVLTNPVTIIGQKGSKRDQEETNEGTIYVRWGHDQYQSVAQLVYYTLEEAEDHITTTHSGGDSNPQCLPLNPNFLTSIIVDHSTKLACIKIYVL